MLTFAERLHEALASHPDKDRRPTQADVARAAGIKSSSMADWFSGNTKPEHVKALPLLKASAFLCVRPQWLLEGRGPRNSYANTATEARERSAAWDSWPFPSIPRARFDRLPDRQKGLVEGRLMTLLDEAEHATKTRAA